MAKIPKRWCPKCEKFISPDEMYFGPDMHVTVSAFTCPFCLGPTNAQATYGCGTALVIGAAMIAGAWWFWPGLGQPNIPAVKPLPAPLQPVPVAPQPAVGGPAMDAQAPLPGLDAFPPIVEQPIVEAKAADPVVDQEERNRQAATMLDFAKRLLQKSPSAAQKRLKEIVEKYPDTPAAEEARRLVN